MSTTKIKFGLDLPLTDNFSILSGMQVVADMYEFDYVFMPDHVRSIDGKHPLNVWDSLCMLTRDFESVGLGTMVADVHRANVTTTVQHIETLVKGASGRNILIGLGAGMVYDNECVGIARGNTMDKMVCIMDSPNVSDVKFVIAARGVKMMEFASKYADGWIARHAISFKDYCRDKKTVDFFVGDKEFIYAVDVSVVFNMTNEIRKKLSYKYLLQTEKYFKCLMTPEDIEHLNRDASMVKMSDIEKFAIIGDESAVERKLQKFIDIGVNLFTVKLYSSGDYSKFGRVMERLREKN